MHNENTKGLKFMCMYFRSLSLYTLLFFLFFCSRSYSIRFGAAVAIFSFTCLFCLFGHVRVMCTAFSTSYLFSSPMYMSVWMELCIIFYGKQKCNGHVLSKQSDTSNKREREREMHGKNDMTDDSTEQWRTHDVEAKNHTLTQQQQQQQCLLSILRCQSRWSNCTLPCGIFWC